MEKTMMTMSAPATTMKGAQGATLSNKMPPTYTNVVVPIAPKKKAMPHITPLTVFFMCRKNMTSTLMCYHTEAITRATHKT